MKTYKIYRIVWLIFLMTGWITAKGQDQLEVPGDNFSLEGALELFKKSESPKEFEQMLNNPDSRVNNLDLNGDGYIDYIRVIDMFEGNVHVFVLQALVNAKESQDVAVITLEKRSNGKAVLQITGDEDIYGVETIIEPTREVYTYAGTTSYRAVVNVWSWPLVRYVYGPYYSVWVSPWGWGYRPYWWRPWRPVVYYDYYAYWRPYRHYYSPCYTHRVVYAHHIYRPHRTTSVIVHKRHHDRITHYRSTRIVNNDRERYNRDRSGSQRTNTSVRYDTNGRIRTDSNQRISSRSTTNTRTQQLGMGENRRSSRIQDSRTSTNRSQSDSRVGSSNSLQRSSGLKRNESSDKWSGTTNRNNTVRKQQPTSSRISRNGSSVNTDSRRSFSRSSGSNQRSSSVPKVQRSTQRSSGRSTIQRSTGSSNVRRSGSATIQRSTSRSSSSAAIQRSSGRSSGNSSVSRSSGRSSGGSPARQSSSSNRQSRGRH